MTDAKIYKWRTTNKNGDRFRHTHKPVEVGFFWLSPNLYSYEELIDTVEPPKNWTKTLERIE